MNAVGAFYEMLTTNTTVSGLVSNRVFPVRMPQKTILPAIVLSIVFVQPNDTKSGPSGTDTVRLQVSIYAHDYRTAENIASAVRFAVDKFAGTVLTTPQILLGGVRFESEENLYEDTTDVFHIAQDYIVRVVRYDETMWLSDNLDYLIDASGYPLVDGGSAIYLLDNSGESIQDASGAQLAENG